MKKKSNRRKRNRKKNNDEYIDINDGENNDFIDYSYNENNNIHDKKYKKIMIVCIFFITLIKIYFFILSKNNITSKVIPHNKLIYEENSNQTFINSTIITNNNTSLNDIKNKSLNIEPINEINKNELNKNEIIKNENKNIKEKIEIQNPNPNQNAQFQSEDKSNFITSDKIYWRNNTIINLTKVNEEISNYENMTPTFNNKEELYKRENPKVSIVIPVYNQAKFVKKIYVCFEKQTLKDIEIIFVDDWSKDNSSKTIEELMEIDKRVVYIKNEENRGVFYSRSNGILHAKGEYILLVDIDDYILNDILIKAYETAKMYNLDVLHFYAMAGDFKKNILWSVLKFRSGIIRGNEVKNVFFRGTTRNIWDKLVKREVYVKSINFMRKD